jgi:hypothetical protein
MAIKVNGTTIIDDSRQLTNIASVDSVSVAALGAAGVGGGSHSATASGAIAAGSTVMVNPNGTLSQVTGSEVSVSGQIDIDEGMYYPQAQYTANDTNGTDIMLAAYSARKVGSGGSNTIEIVSIRLNSDGTLTELSTVQLYNGSSGGITITYDPNADKFLCLWTDYPGSGSHYTLKSVVVTVASDGTITKGSLQNIETAAGYNRAIRTLYDPDSAQHIVQSGTGLRALTVSGNSVSYGSKASYNSSIISNGAYSWGMGYDTTANKLIISVMTYYENFMMVGTVSGTSISLSATQQFGTGYGGGGYTAIDIAHDPVKNQTFFLESETNGYVKGILFTLSGTTLTQVFSDNAIGVYGGPFATENVHLHYDAASASYVAGLRTVILQIKVNDNNDGFQEVQKETIPILTGHSLANGAWPQITSNPATGGLAISVMVRDSSNTDHDYIAFNYTPTNTNMFSGVYIGISEGAYADGDTASVLVTGGISADQTGLTPGSEYYVRLDGSLSLTASDSLPTYAGAALSATELCVKS